MKEDNKNYIKVNTAVERLSYGEASNITTYIYGVTGTGKTMLVHNYLGKRKFYEIDATTMSKDNLIFSKANKNKKIVVIENLHELPFERHDEITEAILELMDREDIWLILISRSPIPPWLMEMRLHYELNIIDETKLVFTEELADKFIEKSGMLFTPEQKRIALQRTNGFPFAWAVAQSVYHEMVQGVPRILEKDEFAAFVDATVMAVYRYLEYHVYDQWEEEIQDFLAALSIVDSFTQEMAEYITGNNKAGQLIDRVKWKGNFLTERIVDKDVTYVMQNGMKLSLRQRLHRQYKRQQVVNFYLNAGMYYRIKGQPLLALKMFEQVDARDRIVDLLVDNARIAPGKGYFYELKNYYLQLEDDEVLGNPFLMEAMCMLQSLLLNPEESERWYTALAEYAKTQQGSKKRDIKSRLLYLDMALLHRGSAEFKEILMNAGLLISKREVIFSNFTLTSNLPSLMNGGKDFCEWSKKDRELASLLGKVLEMVFGKQGKAVVNLGLAESFLEKGLNSYEISSYAARGKMQAEALEDLELTFVADGILIWLHMMNGQSDVASEILETFLQKARTMKNEKIIANAETFVTRIAMYEGNHQKVLQWLDTAPNEEMAFNVYDRFHYLTKVRAYLLTGKNQLAYTLLMKLQYYAEVAGREYILHEVRLLQAIILYRTGMADWKDIFSQVLDFASEHHFIRLVSREGAAVHKLLKETTWGIDTKERSFSKAEKEFLKELLKETEAVTHFYPGYLKVGKEEVVLSENATKILRYLEQGTKQAVIMQELGLTEANVKYHIAQIYKKLNVNNRAEAVAEAKKLGIL